MKKIFVFIPIFISSLAFSQNRSRLTLDQWVDSVFNSLTPDQRIAQLMVIRAHSNLGADHVSKVTSDIQKYNVGALCFFQGGPVRQANLTNFYQGIAKTPLMITIDGEWGVGMRLDSVTKFPYQLTLGAMDDQRLVYEMGLAVGEQCKRLGIHVNYAPVVDINNNPNNPVIGYRSFGEDKYKVAKFGIAYMKGMQDAGIMACAKHFPGHGDVDVDSHLDLPVIHKNRQQLDSMELYPFREIFNAGIGSVMVAHLSIPAIDATEHVATSISKNSVTGVLRNDLNYQGLTFTDALEMKGVAKYFPGGVISVEALVAGNDMLCLPEDVGKAIDAIKDAIKSNRLTWDDINSKVKKVLKAKYQLGLNQLKPIETTNLVRDLNVKTDAIRLRAAKESITVLKQATGNAALPLNKDHKIAYIAIGDTEHNNFGRSLSEGFKTDAYFLSWKDGDAKADEIFEKVIDKYDVVVIGVHNFSNRPANNYGISNSSLSLWRRLNKANSITLVFGNVLAAANYCHANALIACYQDDNITRQVTADLLKGRVAASGELPVRVCNYSAGFGVDMAATELPDPLQRKAIMAQTIDSIVADAIAQKAFPGCVVLATKGGEIIFNKAYGTYTFDDTKPVTLESIYDLASVTKISATTISVMKLYEEGRLDLKKKLGDYLPFVKGTDKENLQLEDILLHQAGLVPFIPFYRETIDSATGVPDPGIYADKPRPGYSIRVAENVYLRNDWQDTMMKRILQSPLGKQGRYVYSDNDFIFLGKIVEQLTGMTLDQYVLKTFYTRIGMRTTGFKPRERFWNDGVIVPTEHEKHFRQQLIEGDVHDEGASMFGGVAGHAGLFSNAYDLAMLYQMLLDKGTFNGERFLKEETIKKFTAYGSKDSRRGLGFDKPEKDNETREEPYPSLLASPQAFGHTGFTGTCVWVDPEYDLVYIFLSNRVNPTRNNPLLSQLLVRGKIQDAIVEAIK
ncbi:MAG TPA: glycoside hydrolase family 3 N-terminal domain-containing protein [Chitinophagaceae bacterium]|nr:glycoside hydrolase family 3 N-terminal domain-containing protein [Chitinophagaceae bacterium]